MTEESIPDNSPVSIMLEETNGDLDLVWQRIAGGLEFLILRAALDGPFYMTSETGNALIVFAADDEARSLREMIPAHYKDFEDPIDEAPDFATNQDPGDEQPDESPAEQE